mmetsp:Transcript_95280/g.254812  ORF Transcript_95280/g.254812 Transcript_95280/m.254812 type:complete len:288 (-) Transcript_95280:2345-3208(-)
MHPLPGPIVAASSAWPPLDLRGRLPEKLPSPGLRRALAGGHHAVHPSDHRRARPRGHGTLRPGEQALPVHHPLRPPGQRRRQRPWGNRPRPRPHRVRAAEGREHRVQQIPVGQAGQGPGRLVHVRRSVVRAGDLLVEEPPGVEPAAEAPEVEDDEHEGHGDVDQEDEVGFHHAELVAEEVEVAQADVPVKTLLAARPPATTGPLESAPHPAPQQHQVLHRPHHKQEHQESQVILRHPVPQRGQHRPVPDDERRPHQPYHHPDHRQQQQGDAVQAQQQEQQHHQPLQA